MLTIILLLAALVLFAPAIGLLLTKVEDRTPPVRTRPAQSPAIR